MKGLIRMGGGGGGGGEGGEGEGKGEARRGEVKCVLLRRKKVK